jgi:glycosyltransferase involved in cell wall biosynthesis
LTNLQILGSQPKARIPRLIQAADCALVPLRNLEIFGGALPTKMFEAMACAKPVVLGVTGEAVELMQEAGGGICISPDNPAAVGNAILALRSNYDQARELGRRGREYVTRHFSRDARARQLSEMLEAVAGQKPRPLSLRFGRKRRTAAPTDAGACTLADRNVFPRKT